MPSGGNSKETVSDGPRSYPLSPKSKKELEDDNIHMISPFVALVSTSELYPNNVYAEKVTSNGSNAAYRNTL